MLAGSPTSLSAAGRFYTKKLCSRLCLIEIELYFLNSKKLLFDLRFGGLKVTYALCL